MVPSLWTVYSWRSPEEERRGPRCPSHTTYTTSIKFNHNVRSYVPPHHVSLHWLTTSNTPESDHKPSTIRDEVEQQQEHIQEKVEKQAENTKATETDSTFHFTQLATGFRTDHSCWVFVADRTAKGSSSAVVDGRAVDAPTV
jgi:hypothetical protein